MKKLLMIMLIAFAISACIPPAKIPKYVEVNSNETAFVVPMEGSTSSQGKFESIDFLEKSKVATKRIYLDQVSVKTGRMYWNKQWIPTVRVIKVDRSPVTLEWTGKDKGIEVESRDSIGFTIGVNISAYVLEKDTAKFLYYYPNGSISSVVSQFVKSTTAEILAREYSKYTLEDCRAKKGEIIESTKKELIQKFSPFGITITTLGLVGGLEYDDPSIQDTINKNFQTALEKENKKNMADAAEEDKRRKLAEAEGDRLAAVEFTKNIEAQRQKIALDIEMMNAQARLKMAENWNGALPSNILPENSSFLMNIKP